MSTDMVEAKQLRTKPIFPDIQYERTVDGIALETYVRILRKGEYYTLLFKQYIKWGQDEKRPEENAAKCYQRLIEHIYFSIHFHEFPEWQESDTNQEPEEERLKKIYPFFSIITKP